MRNGNNIVLAAKTRKSLAVAMLAAGFGCLPVAAQAADPDGVASSEKKASTLAPAPKFEGPLATFAAIAADHGFSFHAAAVNFAEVNPSLGLVRGRAANSLYVIEGVDVDLGKFIGLQGTSLHFENVFFPATENLNIAAQIGDAYVGYQPPFTPEIARLSRLTLEQKLLGGQLDIEAGVTHPSYYYALYNCSSINSCFQSVLYLDAGYSSPMFSVPGGNILYHISPEVYVQAGAFAIQENANYYTGYDFGAATYNGALVMGEIGRKTGFAADLYPSTVSLTGFVSTATHEDQDAASALTGSARTVSGTSGIVLQGDKVVWRRDGGANARDMTPTALKLYASFGSAFDTTVPVQTNAWLGATMMAPFEGRPNDTLGLKFIWQRLNANYASYLTEANFLSGGPGAWSPYSQNSYIFEANAHFALPFGMAFEPVIQYEINPNNYFNPFTATKARDGVYLGGTYVIPLGKILGLQASN